MFQPHLLLMEQYIDQLTGLYLDFLSKSYPEISQKSSPNTLISFAVALHNQSFVQRFDSFFSAYEKAFYWSKPEEELTIFGFDDLITIAENGINRFKVTEKKMKQAKESFFSNWKDTDLQFLPLFLGGMKFSSNKDDVLWSNYEDSLWFIPKFLFVTKSDKSFFIYNNFVNSNFSIEKTAEKYNSKLKTIFLSEEDQEKISPVMISNVTGNSPKDKKKWLEKVKQAITETKNGELQKIVLSRKIEITLTDKPQFSKLLFMLNKQYTGCTIFAYHSGQSTFIGASPERLAKISDKMINIDALAGSSKRGTNEIEDEIISASLLSNIKELEEHKYVVTYINDQLSEISENIVYPSSPQIKKLNNIQHLWTPFNAELPGGKSVMNMLELLHPTPALGGVPKEKALGLIKKLEDYNRGLYAGIIGWVSPDNEGEFTAAIRSALINGKKIIAFAGCGIVEHSIPENEFIETELKLNAIMSLFK